MNTPSLVQAPAVPVWANLVVIVSAVLMAMGAAIALLNPALLVAHGAEISVAVKTYAGYLAARNFTMAAMLLALLIAKARRGLGNIVALVGLIQVFDFAVDCAEGRWSVAPGVLLLGILLLLAAARLSGHAFWRLAAWT